MQKQNSTKNYTPPGKLAFELKGPKINNNSTDLADQTEIKHSEGEACGVRV